ncbi:hypothetical protein AC578_6571 [Pseudocercospora eumusae]|uniref:Uncharacterized protein n=1 Tax=Pseudocercospora eumusae TaxID=321146 RepID=A0A139HHM0_9PEZI|nr:hypothetical protein AC578_6571 [Pseudocercospora eumusae]
MANGKRNKITTPGKATRENRMVLFLLFQIFHFSDSDDETVRQQLATIYSALYKDFAEYNYYNLYDRNVQRLKSGHQNADWKAIDRPNEWNNTKWDVNELAHFATLRNNILREAAKQGIPIAYKTSPEKKHRPLIPGLAPAPAPAAIAAGPSTQAPAQPQHPTGQPASFHPAHTAGNSQANEDENEDSDQDDDQLNYADNIDEAGEGDDEDITMSDAPHPDEAASALNDPIEELESRFMALRYDSEDEDLPSEEDSVDEDITWTDRNTVRGRIAAPHDLQERAIACMNAGREAENPQETVYGREAGGFLTPSWVVTGEMMQQESERLRDGEGELENGVEQGEEEHVGEQKDEEVGDGEGTQGSLFSGELEMLTAEAGETDIERMLADFP